MTIVKQKPKNVNLQRKVQGAHHRKSQKYLKTYWPYIPILGIIGGSILAGVYAPSNLGSSQGMYSARIDSLMGSSNALLLDLMYVAAGLLVFWFLTRHVKRLKSLVLEGEEYLAKHYMLDILLGAAIGSLVILVS